MSAKIFGTTNQIIPQADFQATQDENGGWSATQSFVIKLGDLDNLTILQYFAIGRTATELDPSNEAVWSFLRVKSISPMADLGGYRRVLVMFQGFFIGQGPDNTLPENAYPTFSLRGSNRQEPLSKHPKWKALDQNEQLALGKLLSGEFAWGEDPFTPSAYTTYRPGDPPSVVTPDPIQSADAIEFAKRIASGETTYERGAYEWWKRWDSNVPLTDSQLNSLGKITTPPGNPPSPGSGRNWMMIAANQEQQGSKDPTYQIEIGFLLSDEGGWDSFLQS